MLARWLLALMLAATASTVWADVYLKDELIDFNRDAAAGGKGTLQGQFAFRREAAQKNEAIKEIGWMTLQPGDSIGFHQHKNNEDAYIIVSGVGTFTDSDGQSHQVKAGDVTIARKGQSHGLANTGKEPLVFIDVIAEQ
jgi:mannose-6-phosphate isomerase-like protein (cupin superfamily)